MGLSPPLASSSRSPSSPIAQKKSVWNSVARDPNLPPSASTQPEFQITDGDSSSTVYNTSPIYSSGSIITSSSSLSAEDSSLMTRSLEFPDRTSFRIFGGGDREMDRMYRSLGVSGPEDLAISTAAWEASQKKRSSSDVIDRFTSLELDNHKFQVHDSSEAGPSGDAVAVDSSDRDDTELTRSESSEIGSFSNLADKVVVDGGAEAKKRGIERTPTILVNSRGYLVPNPGDVVGGGAEAKKRGIERTPTVLVKSRGYLVPNPGDVVAVVGGGGIKGPRPPVLKPPPSMKRLSMDHQGSSWDFLDHFASQKKRSKVVVDGGAEENKRGMAVSNTSPIYSSGSIITSWQKGGLLGRGSFGSVYEGFTGDGDFFAVKEVSLLEQGSQAQECIQQLEGEIALLSQLQHPNIVRYRGTAKDESNLYIFLELVTQGSLLKLYQRYQLRDSLQVVSGYTRQILDGLKYLHDHFFIHRDIKCANILVDANGVVKLADFGLAKVSKLNDIKSCKGTPFWMAPEVINPKRNDGYGSLADIWSLGCTVLEMLTGKIPYSHLEPVPALYRIGRGELPEIPESISQDARDFILKCLKVNPEERPTAAELLNHPFVRRPLSSSGSGTGLGSASPVLHRRG